MEVAKKVQLEERIKKEHRKLKEFREYPRVYDDAIREDITKRINALNDELTTRQESIDLLNSRLKNQITSIASWWGWGAVASGGGESPPKDEAGLKEWIKAKLKALACC